MKVHLEGLIIIIYYAIVKCVISYNISTVGNNVFTRDTTRIENSKGR